MTLHAYMKGEKEAVTSARQANLFERDTRRTVKVLVRKSSKAGLHRARVEAILKCFAPGARIVETGKRYAEAVSAMDTAVGSFPPRGRAGVMGGESWPVAGV